MPKEVKAKLREYARAQQKASDLHRWLFTRFAMDGVPYENLTATTGERLIADEKEPVTEGLAFINNCEIDNLNETIKSIENVYLYFVNKD